MQVGRLRHSGDSGEAIDQSSDDSILYLDDSHWQVGRSKPIHRSLIILSQTQNIQKMSNKRRREATSAKMLQDDKISSLHEKQRQVASQYNEMNVFFASQFPQANDELLRQRRQSIHTQNPRNREVHHQSSQPREERPECAAIDDAQNTPSSWNTHGFTKASPTAADDLELDVTSMLDDSVHWPDANFATDVMLSLPLWQSDLPSYYSSVPQIQYSTDDFQDSYQEDNDGLYWPKKNTQSSSTLMDMHEIDTEAGEPRGKRMRGILSSLSQLEHRFQSQAKQDLNDIRGSVVL